MKDVEMGLEFALRAMLQAYAWGADATAAREGEDALHSAVKVARTALRLQERRRADEEYVVVTTTDDVTSAFGPFDQCEDALKWGEQKVCGTFMILQIQPIVSLQEAVTLPGTAPALLTNEHVRKLLED